MAYCTGCGHPLGVGRFCTNCGQQISEPTPEQDAPDWRTDTVVRAPIAPVPPIPSAEAAAAAGGSPPPLPPPPSASEPSPGARFPLYSEPSPGARFPLYADEVPPAVRQPNAPSPAAGPPPAYAAHGEPSHRPSGHRQRSRSGSRGLLLLILAVVLLVISLGIWMLVRDDGGGDSATGPAPADTSSQTAEDEDQAAEETPPEEPAPEAPVEQAPPAAPADPRNLATDAQAGAPVSAPPGQSLDGSPVSFEPARMTDGDPATAWRMPGDGSGTVLTFDLPEGSVLTEVGLINGYAKQDVGPGGRTVRWYRQNRTVEQVTWVFDDGTQHVQSLETTPQLQTMPIDPIRATQVRLRIDRVSQPGSGPRARDFTPVSEVLLSGGFEG